MEIVSAYSDRARRVYTGIVLEPRRKVLDETNCHFDSAARLERFMANPRERSTSQYGRKRTPFQENGQKAAKVGQESSQEAAESAKEVREGATEGGQESESPRQTQDISPGRTSFLTGNPRHFPKF